MAEASGTRATMTTVTVTNTPWLTDFILFQWDEKTDVTWDTSFTAPTPGVVPTL